MQAVTVHWVDRPLHVTYLVPQSCGLHFTVCAVQNLRQYHFCSRQSCHPATLASVLRTCLFWICFALKLAILPFCCLRANVVRNYVSSIKELSGENSIYRFTNKYSFLKTKFRNDNSYTLTLLLFSKSKVIF